MEYLVIDYIDFVMMCKVLPEKAKEGWKVVSHCKSGETHDGTAFFSIILEK